MSYVHGFFFLFYVLYTSCILILYHVHLYMGGKHQSLWKLPQKKKRKTQLSFRSQRCILLTPFLYSGRHSRNPPPLLYKIALCVSFSFIHFCFFHQSFLYSTLSSLVSFSLCVCVFCFSCSMPTSTVFLSSLCFSSSFFFSQNQFCLIFFFLSPLSIFKVYHSFKSCPILLGKLFFLLFGKVVSYFCFISLDGFSWKIKGQKIRAMIWIKGKRENIKKILAFFHAGGGEFKEL